MFAFWTRSDGKPENYKGIARYHPGGQNENVRRLMIDIDPVDLKTELLWTPGVQARVWCLQPRLNLSAAAPFLPGGIPGEPSGLDLLKAALHVDRDTPPTEAPTVVVLPEYSLRPDEIYEVRRMIRGAAHNTIVIGGCGQMTAAQARAIENVPLWEGDPADHYTNCALVGFGGSDRLYLQPKIIPSRWEQENLWRGRVVRYFIGRYFQFVIFVCADLLEQPEGRTLVRSVVQRLREPGLGLNLVFWLQHNQRPRSEQFREAIAELEYFSPTVLVVSSRGQRPARLNNYAVSGAIVPQTSLPRNFIDLDRRFRYVEPIHPDMAVSRVVFLRYDAQAHFARTVLADSLRPQDGAAKGNLFQEVRPYSLDAGALKPSNDLFHLVDMCAPAVERASHIRPEYAAQLGTIAARLAALSTPEFLGFLDVSYLPRPKDPRWLHAAGQPHPDGDFRCTCWPHRECIDQIQDGGAVQAALEQVLIVAAALESQGIAMHPHYNSGTRTNFTAHVAGRATASGIVYPYDAGIDQVIAGLAGHRPARIVDSPYIILLHEGRVSLANVDAAEAPVFGAVDQARTARPVPRAIYPTEFWAAVAAGTLPGLIGERWQLG